uniref:G domain-containing protein n=1 Tax=Panagrolaimus sp. ES5 TaxID=591445 RepID=A0AC34F7K2_9BILA
MALIPEHKTYNILLLGESAVGKSAFINAFANYLTYKDFDEALKANETVCVIPSRYGVTFADFERKSFFYFGMNRADIENENISEQSSSATKKPRIYSFYKENIKFNFIDVPGSGSTYGIFQDIENKKYIISVLKSFTKIHGIFILMKPNESRLTPNVKYNLNEIFMLFDCNGVPNIMFIFTYSRSFYYRPASTFEILKVYFEELEEKQNGILIELNRENVFCIDNEAYAFQCGWNKSEEYRNESTDSFNSYKTSWNHSKSEVLKILERILMHTNEYDPNLSLKIEQARTFIYDEIYCLQFLKALPNLVPPRGLQWSFGRLSNSPNHFEVECQKIMFEDIFKQHKHINYDITSEQNKFEITDNLFLNISSSHQSNFVHCHLQIRENEKEKSIYTQVSNINMVFNDAETFFKLFGKILQRDKSFIEETIPKLCDYLKKNAIISCNNTVEERIKLEIQMKEYDLENKQKKSEKMGLLPPSDELIKDIKNISAEIVKLKNLINFHVQGIKAIEDSNDQYQTIQETDFEKLFFTLNNLSYIGINIKKVYDMESPETNTNDKNYFKKLKLLQIYYLKFKASLYFASNCHHKIIFVSGNESLTIPFLKALINNFDCFFIEDCFAFNEQNFHGLKHPKRYLLEVFEQKFDVLDIPMIDYPAQRRAFFPQRALQKRPGEDEIKSIVSKMDKITAICLFIEINNSNQEIQLKNYLYSFSKNDFDKIFFFINCSNISSFVMKHIFFRLKHTVENYNKENDMNIKFENKNVFIFNNNAIEEFLELIEIDENPFKIPEQLYESCKYFSQEIQRFFKNFL